MTLVVSNIWEPFGLRRDPFFQEELQTDPGADYPVGELFVGRTDELSRIGRQLGSADPSRLIIQGGPGVGKTSFVNRLKIGLAEGGFVVHEQPVRITSRTDPDGFLADVLRVLVRMHTAGGGKRDAFWKRASFLVEGATVTSGGLSVGPAGVSVQHQRHAAETGRIPLLETVLEGLARTREAFGSPVVVHVNNLENLSLEDATRAAVLMQNVRDVFAQPGAHWLMVGASGIEGMVFGSSAQVSGFFPHAVTLDPLTPDEVGELLALRYDHLKRRSVALVPPVEPPTAASLYGRYRGDLRNFLRLLSEASHLLLGVDGVTPLGEDQIVATMAGAYREQVVADLGEQDYDYLRRLAEAGTEDGFRVAEVTDWLSMSQAGASGIVARLVAAGLLSESRREGKSVYYRLTGVASVAVAG